MNSPTLPKKPIPVSGRNVNIKETTPKITAIPLPVICKVCPFDMQIKN